MQLLFASMYVYKYLLALCAFPQADITNASFTDTQTISLTPLDLIESAFSI